MSLKRLFKEKVESFVTAIQNNWKSKMMIMMINDIAGVDDTKM